MHRFQKRVLHGGFDQTPLEFVGERPRGQGQRLVEWKDARCSGTGVAHTNQSHGSKDGGERAGAEPAMRVDPLTVLLMELQGGAHISVATVLQMGLEE